MVVPPAPAFNVGRSFVFRYQGTRSMPGSTCGDMHQSFTDALVMAAVWNRAGHYIFALWFLLLSFYLFFSPNLSRRRLDIFHFHTWCGLSANLGCRSETCCTRLAENTGRKKSPKTRHLRTIAQLCQAIFATKAYIDNRKKMLNSNNSYTCHFNQYICIIVLII